MYTYALLDPRPAARAMTLAGLAVTPTLGVEVTIPELADACQLGNIDPQHAGQNPDQAAIEAALNWPPPPAGTQLATIRPDADAFGTMAVLTLRAQGQPITGGSLERANQIGTDDRTAGEWAPGQDINHVTPLQALKAVCFDRLSAADKVGACIGYLRYGEVVDFAAIADSIRAERREHAAVATEVVTTAGGRIAVVESNSRFAVTAAYQRAPVVVAVNPRHPWPNGLVTRKATVCQQRPGQVDLGAVFADLNEIQPGWAGSPVIGGSPQGVDCEVPIDTIVAAVAKHLV